jgi:predicted dehydrogenase
MRPSGSGRGRFSPATRTFSTGKPFGFGYHLDLNAKRIASGDQEPSNYTLQLQEFIRAVREGRAPIASAEEIARTTMPVLDAARRSDLEKRIVVFGE